jgi:hypothetical protein
MASGGCTQAGPDSPPGTGLGTGQQLNRHRNQKRQISACHWLSPVLEKLRPPSLKKEEMMAAEKYVVSRREFEPLRIQDDMKG